MPDYEVPLDEQARLIQWSNRTDMADNPVTLRWWHPTTVPYGGRKTAVTVDNRGAMQVYNSRREHAGTATHPTDGLGPGPLEYWELAPELADLVPPALSLFKADAWQVAQLLRGTGAVLCEVDGAFGVAAAFPEDDRPSGPRAARWSVAAACIALGHFPPMGLFDQLDWDDDVVVDAEWATAVAVLGKHTARRVKRALLNRMLLERRGLRERGAAVTARWV